MVFTAISAEVIYVFKQPLGIFMDSILKRGRAPSAMNGPFCRGAIVTGEINNQCVLKAL